MAAALRKLGEEELSETITIPWFNDPPLKVTKRQALAQAAIHSHYHRGQNASLAQGVGRPAAPDGLDRLVSEGTACREVGMTCSRTVGAA